MELGSLAETKELRKLRACVLPHLEAVLLEQVKEMRDAGLPVHRNTVKVLAEVVHKTLYGKEFKAGDKLITNFFKRAGMVCRKATNKKPIPETSKIDKVQAWHQHLVNVISSQNQLRPLELHPIWGRFLASCRVSMDEVPLPFVIDADSTYDFRGAKRVWTIQPGNGLDKRQATLILAIAAEGEQPRPAIIFRNSSNGEGLSAEEKAFYASLKGVDVYYQANAWMDSTVMAQWVERTWGDYKKAVGKAETLLMMDNLGSHKAPDVLQSLKERHNTLVMFGPPGATELWQAIDQGECFVVEANPEHNSSPFFLFPNRIRSSF